MWYIVIEAEKPIGDDVRRPKIRLVHDKADPPGTMQDIRDILMRLMYLMPKSMENMPKREIPE